MYPGQAENIVAKSSTTFAVSDVTPATEPRPQIPYREAVMRTLDVGMRQPVESCSRNSKQLLSGIGIAHNFVSAAITAFARHYPLVLSPDMIWLLIVKAFALHVNANAEALRHKFVAHEGQLTLKVVRNQFVKGFEGNNWEGVFREFSGQIKAHVGEEAHGFVVRPFSTTGFVEQAAMEIALLDVMQRYFDYQVYTRCGIPAITLEGTPADWERVYAGAEQLESYGLDWWLPYLLPVLEQFARSSRGDVDTAFWQSFVKAESRSGGDTITGYILAFFPYLGQQELRRNPCLDLAGKASDPAAICLQTPVTEHHLPSGLSVAPFTWNYYDQKLPMEFMAGFVGVAQDETTLALRPEIGWIVHERMDATP